MQDPIENIEAIIWKYLGGEANEAESKMIDQWKNQPENQKIWDEYVTLFGKFLQAESSHTPADVDVDKAWSKVKNTISVDEPKIIKLNTGLSQGRWLKYAAAILLTAGLGWFMFSDELKNTEHPTVISYTPSDTLREITLPDGSLVALKAGASLSYHSEVEGVRKVVFFGNGFFDIHRDTSMPFVIETGHALVSVLGTSFYIETDTSGEVQVSVNSGKVQLSHKDPESNEDVVVLEKGEKGKVKDRKKPLKETLQTMNFLSWRSHKLRFKDTPLEHVFEDLEAYYNVTFVVENESLYTCRLSGKFYKQTLDELLEMLGLTFDLQISRNEEIITVQGEGCQ